MSAPATSPGERWRASLRAWEVPAEIREKAQQPEWTLEPEMFRWRPDEDARQPLRPSRRRALEVLPEGGSVLDVGVGGGASSLGLAPRAGHITGVDRLEGMLASFEASARDAGVACRTVLGTWPDVADQVEPADVAVCHHAVYMVAGIEDFVTALTSRARRRVVVEVAAHPPLWRLAPLWERFHGIERADRPVADELEAVLAALGFAVEREDASVPVQPHEATPERVAFLRRRLYVGEERDPEIAEFLRSTPPSDQEVVALWWPGGASA